MNFARLRPVFSFVASAALLTSLAACASTTPASPGSGDDAGGNAIPDAGSSGIDSAVVDSGLPTKLVDSSAAHDSASGSDSAASEDSGNENDDGSSDAASAPDTAQASPYSVSCISSASTCPGTGLICQSFGFGGGAITGYACTQTCSSVSDCGEAPAGFSVACQAYTTGGFCVLTCDPNSTTSCPAPLECTADEGEALGICVSF